MLAEGALVAIPTDTIYGLVANALDKYAVARIYEAKGRSINKALVVFIPDLQTAKKLTVFTPLALRLATGFWPGALTMVLKRPKSCPLPDILTAGLDTLAIRIPKNPVALALLKTSHLPLAVTSANLSGSASPITAQDVAAAMSDRVDLILDGGPTALGRESTLMDVTGEVAVILRLGATPKETLETFLKAPVEGP